MMGSDSERKEKKKKCKPKIIEHALSDSSDNIIPVPPFSADILPPAAPNGDSAVDKGETSTVERESSDPIIDAALESFKSVNREQLGSFMHSFSKFIEAGGHMPGNKLEQTWAILRDIYETLEYKCRFS